jgi:hypothetical protein
MATVVPFMGGPHVHLRIDTPTVLAKLKPVLTEDVYDDVCRILTRGAPALCNAKATHQNFDAYLQSSGNPNLWCAKIYLPKFYRII